MVMIYNYGFFLFFHSLSTVSSVTHLHLSHIHSIYLQPIFKWKQWKQRVRPCGDGGGMRRGYAPPHWEHCCPSADRKQSYMGMLTWTRPPHFYSPLPRATVGAVVYLGLSNRETLCNVVGSSLRAGVLTGEVAVRLVLASHTEQLERGFFCLWRVRLSFCL